MKIGYSYYYVLISYGNVIVPFIRPTLLPPG